MDSLRTQATIFYSQISQSDRPAFFDDLLRKFPFHLQERIAGYRVDKDRFLRITGKALLFYALQKMNLDPGAYFTNYKYSENNKPSFGTSNIRFSLSYSGDIAICAIANHENIGIDIEEIKPIKLSLMEAYFDAVSWQKINNAPDPLAEFYRYWTLLEATLKTLGCPISQLESLDTRISDDMVIAGGKAFYYSCPVIEPGYKCCIASAQRQDRIELSKVPLALLGY